MSRIGKRILGRRVYRKAHRWMRYSILHQLEKEERGDRLAATVMSMAIDTSARGYPLRHHIETYQHPDERQYKNY